MVRNRFGWIPATLTVMVPGRVGKLPWMGDDASLPNRGRPSERKALADRIARGAQNPKALKDGGFTPVGTEMDDQGFEGLQFGWAPPEGTE